MKIIVGLGNPGPNYEKTRHNAGFRAMDALAQNARWENKKRMLALAAHTEIAGEKILLIKPQTFMNRSGESVVAAMHFHKLSNTDVVVVYDDIDLPVGMVRFRSAGSSGGHNGLASVLAELGTNEVKRVKIGIAEDKVGKQTIPSEEYVLKLFSKKGEKEIAAVLEKFPELIANWFEKKFGENDTWVRKQ